MAYRYESRKFLVLHLLYELGDCLKDDVMNYMKCVFNEDKPNYINVLSKEGLIKDKVVKKKSLDDFKKDVHVLTITPEGGRAVRNALDSQNKHEVLLSERKGRETVFNSSFDYSRSLIRNTSLIYFLMCGIEPYTFSKPSFEFLYQYTHRKILSPKEGYLDKTLASLPPATLKSTMEQFFEKGLVYTKAEMTDFLTSDMNGLSYDEIRQSRIQSVFMSKKNLLFTYVPLVGSDNRLKVRPAFEENIVKGVSKLFKNNLTFSPQQKETNISGSWDYVTSALVFASNPSIIRSMANGASSEGVIKEKKLPKKFLKSDVKHENKGYIDMSNNLYDHIYCVECKQDGAKDLSLLLTTTPKERIEYAQNIMTSIYKNNPIYRNTRDSVNIICGEYKRYIKSSKETKREVSIKLIPIIVYDIKTFDRIHKNFKNSNGVYRPGILTRVGRAELISQCLRLDYKEGIRQLYFSEFREENNKYVLTNLNEDSVTLFNETGQASGKAKLLDCIYAAEMPIPTESQIASIYKQLNFPNKTSFYNHLYRYDEKYINSKVIPLIAQIEKKKARKVKYVRIALTDEEYELLENSKLSTARIPSRKAYDILVKSLFHNKWKVW